MIGIGIYDLSRCPPSYNSVDSLLTFEDWRISRGFSKLSIVVKSGPLDGFRKDALPPSGKEERTRWLNNIVLPMPVLLPSCGVPAVLVEADYKCEEPSIGLGEYLIGLKQLVKMAKANNYPFRAPPELVAAARAKYGNRYVTITERNTGWWVQRTTNLDEMLLLSYGLKDMGYEVVLVPEGTKADRFIPGFITDPEAGRNVLVRAALYAGSEMNFGLPCGPMWLAMFMGAPLIMYKMITSDEPSTSRTSYEAAGLLQGAQMPNARPRQRLLWAPEKAQAILGEFDSVLSDRAA